MSIPLLHNIKSRTPAILRAFEVFGGTDVKVKYLQENDDFSCWNKSRSMSLQLNYLILNSGIFLFDIAGRYSIPEDTAETITLKGSLNAPNKIVDDIFFRQYRIVLDYETGVNNVRKRYLADENRQGVFCDYRILRSYNNKDILSFRINTHRLYTSGDSSCYNFASLFIHADSENPDFTALLVSEKNCQGWREYDPFQGSFPNDGRETCILKFDSAGRFVNGEVLCNESRSLKARLPDERRIELAKGFFNVYATNFVLNYEATLNKIMDCVDNCEVIEMDRCIKGYD